MHIGRSWLRPPAAALTVARNWAGSSGKLAIYSNSSSSAMHMYSGLYTIKEGLLIAQKEARRLEISSIRIFTDS